MPEREISPQVEALLNAVGNEITKIRGRIIDIAEQLPSLPKLLAAIESQAAKCLPGEPLYHELFELMRRLDAAGILDESDTLEFELMRRCIVDRILDLLNGGFGSEVELVRGPTLDLQSLYQTVSKQVKYGQWNELLKRHFFTNQEAGSNNFYDERNFAQRIKTWQLATLAADHLSVVPVYFKRGSSYFVAGCPAAMGSISEHFVLHRDALKLVNHARERVDVVLIGDEAGIMSFLRREGCPSPLSSYKDWFDSLDEREGSESIGLYMQMLLQAAQQQTLTRREFFEDALFNDDEEPHFKSEYRPILRSSEILAPGKEKIIQMASILFEKLTYNQGAQGPADGRLAELLWRCVPVNIRTKQFGEELGKKNYKDFRKAVQKLPNSQNASDIWQIFQQIMAYALYQTSTTLYLGGTKVGFEGERKFDEVAQHCLEKYGDELDLDEVSKGLKFVHIQAPQGLAQLPAPYVPDPFERATNPTFSIHQSCEKEVNIADSLRSFIEEKLPTYASFLMNIERNLYFTEAFYDVRARDCMLDVEIFKLLRDLTKELSREPELLEILKISGISDVLALENYKLLGKLREMSSAMPFQPTSLDQEITEALEQERVQRRSEFKAFIESATPEKVKYYTEKRAGRLHIDDIDLVDKGRRGLHDFKQKYGEFGSFYLMRYLAQVLSGPLQHYPELPEPIQTILSTLAEVMYPGGSKYINLHPSPEGEGIAA